jgi:ribosomal protein S18 acetylase RimI-like enzyme
MTVVAAASGRIRRRSMHMDTDRTLVELGPAEEVRLTEADAEPAGTVLLAAFRDYPLFSWLLPDAEARDRLLPAFFVASVRYACLCGEAWAVAPNAQFAAVAVWLPVPGAEPTPERLERSGMARLPDLLGADVWGRLETTAGAIEAAQEQAVPPPHRYLWGLGVDPTWQRRGLGEALLRRFGSRAAADGVPTCTWTVDAEGVPYYRRHGYDVVAEGVEPASGLPYWIFRGTGPGG